MSESLNDLILSTEPQFIKLDGGNGNLLDVRQEFLFARQLITKNDFTVKTAGDNPSSLKAAILNVAAIGISLNPALAHAYLVPRDGKICLDISYRGLVKLATDCGAILWAKTELVYENDTFTWNGIGREPEHKADVFKPRGEVVGGYCIAKLPDGSVMVETMSREEMNQIQGTSKAANGPWKTWPDEMRKKSVTKRASKSWPQTDNRRRVDTAISVLNEHEGDQSIPSHETPSDAVLIASYTEEERAEYQRCMEASDYFNLFALKRSLGVEGQSALAALYDPKAEHGKKGAVKKKLAEDMEDAGRQVDVSLTMLMEFSDTGDESGAFEVLEECSAWTQNYLLSRLSGEQARFIQSVLWKVNDERKSGTD